MSAAPKVFHKGNLQKRGEGLIKTWKQRFFVLTISQLSYFEHEGDQTPKGSIELKEVLSVDSPQPTYFNVVTKNRTYELYADSEATAKAWKTKIEMIVTKLREKQQQKSSQSNPPPQKQVQPAKQTPVPVAPVSKPSNSVPQPQPPKKFVPPPDKSLDALLDIQDEDLDDPELLDELDALDENHSPKKSVPVTTTTTTIPAKPTVPVVSVTKMETEDDLEELEDSGAVDDTDDSALSVEQLSQQIQFYKAKAIDSKQKNEIDDAKQHLMNMDWFQSALDNVKQGASDLVDWSSAPLLLRSNDVMNPNVAMASKPQRGASLSNGVAPGQLSCGKLLEILQKQIKDLTALALQEKGNVGKKENNPNFAFVQQLLKDIKTTKSFVQELETLDKNSAAPAIVTENRSMKKKKENPHLTDNELEIQILKGQNFNSQFTGSRPYIAFAFPYPSDNPQKLQTQVTSSTAPDFNHSQKFHIERKKAFQILCEKKRLSLELWETKMLFSSTLLGKADFMMTPLLHSCSMQEMVPLKKAQTRKVIGEIEIKVSLRKPLLADELVEVTTKVLLPASEASSPVPAPVPSPSATATAPAKKATIPPTPTTTPATTAVPKQLPSKGMEQPSKKVTTALPAPNPNANTNTAEDSMEEDDENDPYNPETFTSCAVMEWWLGELAKMAKTGSGLTADQQDQQDQLQMKLNILQTQVEAGVLEPDKYLQLIQHRIQLDKVAAKNLMLKQKKPLAMFAMKKIKLMENEAKELASQLEQMQ